MRKAGLAALLLLALQGGAIAQDSKPWTVRPEWVSAHESFLASTALQGRKSASRDELIAATYVAAQFESYGLKPAPGMKSWLQTAPFTKKRFQGAASLASGAVQVQAGITVFTSTGQPVSAPLVLAASADPRQLEPAEAVLVSGAAPLQEWFFAAMSKGVKLLIVPESAQTRAAFAEIGGQTQLMSARAGRLGPTVITAPAEVLARLQAGQPVTLTPPTLIEDRQSTVNAIGWLQGSDPKAGVLLFSAHVDHLGTRPDGTVMHGANDDASGLTAVLELARALGAGPQPKRSILFVAYGAEELGMLGSKHFAANPPVPLQDIVANIAFEMIGQPDPKLPAGTLMMTGFERSDLGAALQARGFRVTADPYPDQHFFERSDNYQLALRGIVAHTVSGWATSPTYHQATDDIAHLDLPFMTAVIQSLIEPARWLANGDFTPRWKAGGQPRR